jgi:hypothetical protein
LLTRAKEVRGIPARIIGVVLLLPWPSALVVGGVLGGIFAAQGKSVDSPEFKNAVQIASIAVIALWLIVAIAIAAFTAKPIRKSSSKKGPVGVDIPDEYGDHFQPGGGSRSRLEREDNAERPRHPNQPDDRVTE